MRKWKRFDATLVAVCLAAGILSPNTGRSNILTLTPRLAEELVAESVPTAFAINDWTTADFSVEWEGKPVPDVEFQLSPRDLQWGRVSELLVLPRSTLILSAKNAESGEVHHAGLAHPFRIEGNEGRVEVPMALISGADNPVRILLRRQGRDEEGVLQIRFHPRQREQDPRVFSDSSCSRFGLELEQGGSRPDQWVYLGCRQIVAEGASHRIASLELLVFWDGAGPAIEMNGARVRAASPSFWALRVNARPGTVTLRSAAGQEVRVRYRIPEILHLSSLAMGLGPYQYNFEGPGNENLNQIAPIVTLYGSYFFQEGVRMVAFDATAISRNPFTDFGIYLNAENMRVIDRRISINLMLGGHLIGFKSQDQFYLHLGFPQGFELVFYDILKRGSNLSMGAFIYPKINGKAYDNVWIRWGSRTFVEFNYILWEEPLHDQRIFSESMGVTVGFPLFNLL